MQVRDRGIWLVITVWVLPIMLTGCGASPLGILPDLTNPLTSTTETTESSTADLDAAAPIPEGDCLGLADPSDATHQALFDALNEFRAANGLPALVYSERLQAAADAHARDLFERGYFAHINPDGENPGQRALEIGFCHEYVGENIAAGQKSVAAAQVAWENSPSHRENMLEPAYVYAGVGVFQDPTGRLYWAQEMAYNVP